MKKGRTKGRGKEVGGGQGILVSDVTCESQVGTGDGVGSDESKR